jgi:hypothetical protein
MIARLTSKDFTQSVNDLAPFTTWYLTHIELPNSFAVTFCSSNPFWYHNVLSWLRRDTPTIRTALPVIEPVS